MGAHDAVGEIVELDSVGTTAGGKAHGLARLTAMGLQVPPAFVIRGARAGRHPQGLDARHAALGVRRVAVRSSAAGEDGAEASFAGQFDTVLDVEAGQALRAAIDRCVGSATSDRVAGYREGHADDADVTMHVVVQAMVDARAAGVVFTADPVSGRRDLAVVDAVAGLGESLVSGESTPDHWEVGLGGDVEHREVVGEVPVLDAQEVSRIAEQARRAADHEGHPLDLEWAIDRDGRLWWLQARPITTLPADLQEFDTTLPRPDDVLTISNISEMMPGAVCPLTMSVTGWGIDYGLQHMQVSVGARDRIDRDWQITASAYGHLFLNLTGNTVMAAGILGSDANQTAQALCGRVVPELRDLPPMPLWRRVWNTGRLLRYSLAAPRVVDRFATELERFTLIEHPTAARTFDEIAGKSWFFEHAMAVHIQSSALSGFCNAIVENMVSEKRNDSTTAEQAEAARLIAGATDVVSAVMLDELDSLLDDMALAPEVEHAFLPVGAEAATAWLRSSRGFGPRFEAFLDAHGHRGLRELCLRDPSWGDDPTPLVQSMQAAIRARLQAGGTREQGQADIAWDELGRGLRWILPKAHAAIRRREHTKDLLVDVAHRFQLAFRHLGTTLVAEGALPDADLVHFFTLDELGPFVAAPSDDAVRHAQARREALAHQQRLGFPEVSVGLPTPLPPHVDGVSDGVLVGRPASRGVAEGVVRVARTLDAAALLEPGEILVTPITDVAWTPYFSLIGGLVTDLGSSVSHGAVVAREYGLPCVVNTRQGTRVLRTGDRVRLDGDTGTVTVLDHAG